MNKVKEKECKRCKNKVEELYLSAIVPNEQICKECLKKEGLINYD